MKIARRKIAVVFIFFYMLFVFAVQAEDLVGATIEFYSGLAQIIEDNMDDPDSCVSQVREYYRSNQDEVLILRKAAKDALDRMSGVYGKYSQRDSDSQMEASNNDKEAVIQAAMRYGNALRSFSAKYPEAASEVKAESMQLLPDYIQR